jgi:hypothetical protein
MTIPLLAPIQRLIRYLTSKPDIVLLGVILFTLGNSIFAIGYLNNLEASFSRIYEEDLRGENALQTAQTTLLLLDAELKDAMLLTGKTDLQKVRKSASARAKAINASLARASMTLSTRFEKAILGNLKRGVSDYLDKVTDLFNLLETGAAIPDEPLQNLNEDRAAIEQNFLKMNKLKVDDARKTFGAVEFQLHFSMFVTLGTLVFTVIFRFVGHRKRSR